jgi:hypothetical protein
MKKQQLLFLCLLILAINTIVAQTERVINRPNFDKKLIHFGFYLGLNQNDFKIDYKRSNYSDAIVNVEPTPGFNVGLIADIRLHKNINIRFEPGLISNSKVLAFTHIDTKRDSIREIGSTYLHLPIVFKFSTNRLDNVRPYVLAGISFDYNFSSNQENSNDNSGGEFRMKSTNFMYELGIGIDIYLSYFKFSPSIRGVFAINNELKYDNLDQNQVESSPWTSPVNFLGTRGIFLNFSFE